MTTSIHALADKLNSAVEECLQLQSQTPVLDAQRDVVLAKIRAVYADFSRNITPLEAELKVIEAELRKAWESEQRLKRLVSALEPTQVATVLATTHPSEDVPVPIAAVDDGGNSSGHEDDTAESKSAVVLIAAASVDSDGTPRLGRFSGRAYTGAPMRPEGFMSPVIVDLDGVRVPSQHRPMLRQHDHEQVVGHTESVKVTTGSKGGIDVDGLLSGEPEYVDGVAGPAKRGFEWQLSIGASPIRSEFLEPGEEDEVNGRTIRGPMLISRETELGEISFVPLGADGDTWISINSKHRPKDTRAAKRKFSEAEIASMSGDEVKLRLKQYLAKR